MEERGIADAPPPPSNSDAEQTNSGGSGAKPGWYEDPLGGGERYWDGQQWGSYWITPDPTRKADRRNDGLTMIGWITAIVIPLVGLVVGIILSSRDDRRGTPIALTAVGIFVAWIVFWVILNAVVASSVSY